MLGLRHQLPVWSPLSAASVLRAGAAGPVGGESARDGLEAFVRERYAADRVELTGSGTQALQLALGIALAGRPAHDRIAALPAFSCYDVASAAVGADCRIVLYDLDPATLAPEPGSFERALTAATVAVIAPLYGVPVPWRALEAAAAARGVVLVEDAAQGHGASWEGRRLGSLGRLSVLSFGRGKGWTGGAGGALLLRGGDLPERAVELGRAGRGLGSCATSAVQWALGRPTLYGIPSSIPALGLGQTVYHPPSPPRPMSATAAALAMATRAPADAEAGHRRSVAARWRTALADAAPDTMIAPADESSPGWLRFPVRLPGGMNAFGGDRAAALRLGISPTYPTTLAELPAVQDRLASASGDPWPGAALLARDLVTLPTHSRLAEPDITAVARTVRAVRPPGPAS